MTENTETTPVPPVPTGKSHYSQQDQRIENDAAEILQRIQVVQNDAELPALLEPKGYGPTTGLKVGLDLQQDLQTKFTARQTAMGARGHATATHNGAYLTATHMYADFRATARAIFTSTEDRDALAIRKEAPADPRKFITVARASYAAAVATPYQATLAQYGYPAAHLAEAVAALDALDNSIESHSISKGDAKKATADRNAAYKALIAWNRQFMKIAKVATRNRPDLAKKLNL